MLRNEHPTKQAFSFVFRGTLFLCAYFCPCRSDETLFSLLDTISNWIEVDMPVVLMGDLNARSVDFDDVISNRYGTILQSWSLERGLSRFKPSIGRWTFLRDCYKSIPDHHFGNVLAQERHITTQVIEYFNSLSDHKLLLSEIYTDFESADVVEAPSLWSRYKLKKQSCRVNLEAEIESSWCAIRENIEVMLFSAYIDSSETAQTLVDSANYLFEDWINLLLENSIGKTQRTVHWADGFLNADMIEAAKTCDMAYDVWYCGREGPSSHDLWLTYDVAEVKLRKMVTARRKSLFEDFAEKVSQSSTPEKVRMLASIRKSRSRAQPLLKTDSYSMDSYADHFRLQFRNDLPGEGLKYEGPATQDNDDIIMCFDVPKIWFAIDCLATGKAAGESGLFAEVFKVAPEPFSKILMVLFAFCYRYHVIPTSWRLARIQPVAKKGDLTLINNYRPISLTEIPRKLFEKCLLPVVSSYVEPLSIEQGGFRPQRGCYDQVAVLQEFLSQKEGCLSTTSKRKMADRWCAFLDIKAAYDSVDRSLLWNRCIHIGLPGNLISVLQVLFDNNFSYVALNGKQSGQFPIASGVLQGSLLSPILYSVFIDGLVDYLRLHGPSPQIGGTRMNCLLYADDIALLAESPLDLQELLNLCNNYSIDFRFRFNVQKCAVFTPAKVQPRRYYIYGEAIPIVESFTYLGFEFRVSGIDWDLHFRRMIGRARKTLFGLRDLGCNGNGFSMKANLELYRSLLRPIVEYGLALCPKSELPLLEKFHGECLRIFAGVGKSTCIASIGLFADLENVLYRWQSLNFRFWRSLGRKDSKYFAIKRAEAHFNTSRNRYSIFEAFKCNDLIKKYQRTFGLDRFLEDPSPSFCLSSCKEEYKLNLICQYPSAFVFGRDRSERLLFINWISKLPRKSHRNVILWILNRVGRWLVCPQCHEPGGKQHFESCLLKLSSPEFGPSRLEQMLFESCYDANQAVELLDEIFERIKNSGRVQANVASAVSG